MKITKIEVIEKIETYDLEVEKNHNYIANGLVVHNSTQDGLIRSIQPDCFDDIVAITAINRPGPLESFAPVFGKWKRWERENNIEELESIKDERYPFNFMEPVLKNTYGCLLEGELVYNPGTGRFTEIEKCDIEQKTQSWSGLEKSYSKQKVNKVIFTGRKKAFCFRLKTGYELNCTLDHKILTPEGEMSIGEAYNHNLPIALPKTLIVNERSQCLIEQQKYRVLGLLLGDGSIKGSNIYFTNTNETLLTNFETLVYSTYERCSFYKTQHGRKGLKLVTRVNIIKDDLKYINNERLNYTPNDLTIDLRKWGLHGCGSYDKFIPDEVFTANRQSKLQLLSGLWDSDGTLRKSGHAVYGTKSKKLANDIIIIMRQLGYLPTLNKTKENSYLVFAPYDCYLEFEPYMICDYKKNRKIVKQFKNLKNVFPAHFLREQISGSFRKYCKKENLNYELLRKKRNVNWEKTNIKDNKYVQIYNSNYFVEITSKTNLGVKKVYDLSISPLTPWFVIGQGILVHNCLLFQEQFMLMVKEAAGFNLGEADSFRRAIGWREDHPKYHTVKKYFDKLEEGMLNKGYTKLDVDKFLDYCRKFMGYSFNRSHSLAYSYIGMQTLFLKVYYPAYFYANLLNAEDNNERYQNIIADAVANGIQVLSPSIVKSKNKFTVEGNCVRIGLQALKGFGDKAYEELEALEVSKCTTIYEVLSKPFKKVNSKAFQALIDTGAFDEFGVEREKIEAIKALYKDTKIEKWFSRKKKALEVETMPESLLQFPEKITLELAQLHKEEPNNWRTFIYDLIPHIKIKTLKPEVVEAKEEEVLGFSMRTISKLSKLVNISASYPELNLQSLTTRSKDSDLVYWFLLKRTVAKTKKGKPYLVLDISDNNITIKAKCWDMISIDKGKAYVSNLKKDNFGFTIINNSLLTEVEL